MGYLHSVRVFQCVIDEGSFAAAACKMDLSPAMVTRQIELSRHRMVRLRPSGSRLQAVGLLNPAECHRTIELSCARSVTSNDDETAYQAALSGAGLALLPKLALSGRPHGGQLRRVMAPWVSVDRLRLVASLAQSALCAATHPCVSRILHPARATGCKWGCKWGGHGTAAHGG